MTTQSLSTPLLARPKTPKHVDIHVPITTAIINVVKTSAGTGVWSLAAAFSVGTGVYSGVSLMLAICMASAWTYSLVGDACEAFDAHVGRFGDRRACGDYRRVWIHCVGPRSALAIDAFLILYTLMVGTLYITTLHSLCAPLLAAVGVPSGLLALPLKAAVGMLCYMLSRLRLMKDMAWTSTLGNVGFAVTLLVVVVRALDGSYAPGGRYEDAGSAAGSPLAESAWAVGPGTAVLALRTGFSAASHFSAPRVYEQLRDRSAARLRVVSVGAYAILGVVYVAAALLGVLTFGSSTLVPVLSSYATLDPLAILARWTNFVSCAMTYPLLFTSAEQPVGRLISSVRSVGCSVYEAEGDGMLALGASCAVLGVLLDDLGRGVTLAGAFIVSIFVWILPALLALAVDGAGRRRPPGALHAVSRVVHAAAAVAVLTYGIVSIMYGAATILGRI